MTITAPTTTTRSTHNSMRTGATPRPYVDAATVGSCPGSTPQYDCPFCSGPETD